MFVLVDQLASSVKSIAQADSLKPSRNKNINDR